MRYFISRKDRIVLSAIDIINELGIQGLSTKELALRQDVNESALYRHFKNKDAILAAVLDYFSQFDKSIFNTSMKKEGNCKDKITDYLRSYLEYYESYPAISSILFLSESLNNDNALHQKAVDIFSIRLRNLSDLITESQMSGEVDSTFSPKELSQLMVGYCNKVILDWRNADFGYSFKMESMETMEKLLSLLSRQNTS